MDYDKPEQMFNAALDTAEYVASLRKGVGEAIMNSDWQSAAKLLYLLNKEIVGWYSKHKGKYKDNIENLEGHYSQCKSLLFAMNNRGSPALQVKIEHWFDVVIKECHMIWLSKEVDKNKVALMG